MKGMICAVVGLTAFSAVAASGDVPLWPEGGMPSVQTNQAVPFLRWFAPEKRTTDAILIAVSGGGYNGDEDGCLAVGAVGEADSDRIRGTRRFVSQRADSKLRNSSKGEG